MSCSPRPVVSVSRGGLRAKGFGLSLGGDGQSQDEKGFPLSNWVASYRT